MYGTETDLPFGAWDGHTHTQMCAHGSREPTREFVRRAVELGIERYSITEHAPLPQGFVDPAPTQDCALETHELLPYLDHAEALRSEFENDLEVCVGLEVDYIAGWESATREMLDAIGARLEDGLLSIHFLPAADGWACVDYSPEDLRGGLLAHHGSLEAFHAGYWNAVRAAVESDLGPHKPRRIGHLTLAHKFRRAVGEPSIEWTLDQVEPILRAMRERGMALDVNAAGLEKPDCGLLYPPAEVLALARDLGIAFVYGSDAHAVQGVGQLREEVRQIVGS